MNYYISDMHLGHKNVLKFDGSALRYFESVERLCHIKDRIYNVILCHFPMADWNAKHRGAYHVYGHIHNRKDEVYEFMKRQERALNAGCMINHYEPVTIEELIENNRRFQESV